MRRRWPAASAQVAIPRKVRSGLVLLIFLPCFTAPPLGEKRVVKKSSRLELLTLEPPPRLQDEIPRRLVGSWEEAVTPVPHGVAAQAANDSTPVIAHDYCVSRDLYELLLVSVVVPVSAHPHSFRDTDGFGKAWSLVWIVVLLLLSLFVLLASELCLCYAALFPSSAEQCTPPNASTPSHSAKGKPLLPPSSAAATSGATAWASRQTFGLVTWLCLFFLAFAIGGDTASTAVISWAVCVLPLALAVMIALIGSAVALFLTKYSSAVSAFVHGAATGLILLLLLRDCLLLATPDLIEPPGFGTGLAYWASVVAGAALIGLLSLACCFQAMSTTLANALVGSFGTATALSAACNLYSGVSGGVPPAGFLVLFALLAIGMLGTQAVGGRSNLMSFSCCPQGCFNGPLGRRLYGRSSFSSSSNGASRSRPGAPSAAHSATLHDQRFGVAT